MTCYLRHLKEIFEKAGIVVTGENKQELDKLIHNIAAIQFKNCPAVWKEVKKRIAEDEEGFAMALKQEWNKRK